MTLKKKISIELEMDFNKLKDDNEEEIDPSEIEKSFANILYSKIEEFIRDEEMSLQMEVLEVLCEDYNLENVRDYSDLGSTSISVGLEK